MNERGPKGIGEEGEHLYEHGRQVGAEAKALADDVGSLAEEVQEFLTRQMDERPYATLAAAAGAGYVLGGGIPSWVVRMGVAVGGRVLVGALLREMLVGGGDLEGPLQP